jgi:hypothetical protein
MTYGFTVRTDNGVTTLLNTYGEMPEGEHIVNGHDDGHHINIQITRRDASGRYVIRASHNHDRRDVQVPLAGYYVKVQPDAEVVDVLEVVMIEEPFDSSIGGDPTTPADPHGGYRGGGQM